MTVTDSVEGVKLEGELGVKIRQLKSGLFLTGERQLLDPWIQN